MILPLWLVVITAALFGAAVGSFLNVCIWRLPREGMGISSPRRSHCPSCGFTIPWHDNLPVISWIRLGAHCRSCRSPISARYPAIEVLTAAAFGVITHRYLADGIPQPGILGVVLAVTASCIVLSFIDQDLQIIPDEITIPGMLSVLPLALLIPGLHQPPRGYVAEALEAASGGFSSIGALLPEASHGSVVSFLACGAVAAGCALGGIVGYRLYWMTAHGGEIRPLKDCLLAALITGLTGGVLALMVLRPEWVVHPRIHSFWAALAGMAAGSGLVLGVGILGRQVFRKDAMGFGDVKLMGFLGGFTGWIGVLAGFAIACFIGSAVGIWRLLRSRSRYLPFGPYLALGCLLLIIWPQVFRQALDWYMGLFR